MAPTTTASAPVEQAAESKSMIRMELVNLRFLLKSKPDVGANKDEVLRAIMAIIEENNMAPYYQFLAADAGIPLDNALLARMQAANATALAALQEQLEDVTKNAGSVEVRDALYNIAAHYARIGDKTRGVEAFEVAYEKSVGAGSRLDVLFDMIRFGFIFYDAALIRSKIDMAAKLIEEGGDWDRRNRLKVYEATFLMSIRSFKRASELFIDTLATFTSTELMDLKTFVRYAIISSVVSQDRVTLKNKVIDSPEVLEVIKELHPLQPLLDSLYECRYRDFFVALAETEQQLKVDPLLNPHYVYFTREMRIRAYAQMLESYKSVTIESMAEKFGVSRSFLDAELSRFVAGQRLNCVIDAVGGVIITNRPDRRNAQYQASIKQGDLLLNRVQKLSRVMNL